MHGVGGDRREDLGLHKAVVLAARRLHVVAHARRPAQRRLAEALARHGDRQRALVHAQEAAVQVGRSHGRRAAAREQIAHQVALLRRAFDDALQQADGLLRVVAGALRVLLLQVAHVVPHVARIHRLVVVIAVLLAGGHDRAVCAAVLVDAALHVIAAGLAAGDGHRPEVEVIRARLRVEQDHVVLSGEVRPRPPAGLIGPDDLVEEIALAEDLVHQQAHVRVHAAVDVQEDGAFLLHQVARERKRVAHHGKVRLAAGPAVVVRGQGDGGRAGLVALFADAHLHVKPLARVERRIQVHRLHRAGIARKQLLPARRQRGLHQHAHALPAQMALGAAADIGCTHRLFLPPETIRRMPSDTHP